MDDASVEAASGDDGDGDDDDDDDDDECSPYIEFCFKMKAHPTNDLNFICDGIDELNPG